MFCAKCGEQLPEGSLFCSKCGTAINGRSITNREFHQRVILNPSEQSKKENQTDYGEKTAGVGIALGISLVVAGILCDLVCMFLAASGSFESYSAVMIGGTISFVIGLVIILFCR